MDKNPAEILWAILSTVGIASIGLFVWAIQRQITTTAQNTVQLAVLSDKVHQLHSQIEKLQSYLYRIEKIETDLNHAHSKLRDIKDQFLDSP